jgi:phosphonoacetaldehyde hydrolase
MSRIQAVIFDWAGTLVDFGSIAPVAAFAAAFEAARVPVSVGEIRKPMGFGKREHLQRMLNDEAIAARWHQIYGADPEASDVDRLYNAFDQQLLQLLPHYADPIPGALDVLVRLQKRGLKIGSNSGYAKPQMDVVVRAGREHGLELGCVVSV